MKRTKQITLVILPIILLSACNGNLLKHCVDDKNTVHEEEHCHHNRPGYFWYYGGTNSPLNTGSKISGGSTTPISGKSYSSPSMVSRGGFGGIGKGTSVGG